MRDQAAHLLRSRTGPDVAAEAGELVEAQYRDRPQLRPVLDAVLAALPALGPVTVQARKTLVSLATPRRTFAVVQATTKTRVDLGLRLEHDRPGGQLLAARDLGAAFGIRRADRRFVFDVRVTHGPPPSASFPVS